MKAKATVYVCLHTVVMADRTYQPDEQVTLTDEAEAARLVRLGAVALPAEAARLRRIREARLTAQERP